MTTAELIVAHPADDAAARKQEARKVLWAFLGALFLHLAVGYLLAAWGGVFASAAPAEDKPIELSFVDLSTPVPIAPKNSMFMENEETNQADPKEKTFESNANSTAASEVPATGTAPLPSQRGKDRPMIDLETHQNSLANEGAQPLPSAPPQQTPQPTQAPSQPPTVTPPPDQLAFLTKTPTPPPQSTPNRPQQPKSSYRALKEQTRLSGAITNRGKPSVNAVATPLGKYRKQLYDAVGSRWYFYVGKDRDLINIGTASLVFSVDRSGRVRNLKVVENTSNESFANVCLQSVLEVKLPPMSEDVASTLPPDGLEEEMTFTMFSN
jgi:outer membrane biosynthesis protein TonB